MNTTEAGWPKAISGSAVRRFHAREVAPGSLGNLVPISGLRRRSWQPRSIHRQNRRAGIHLVEDQQIVVVVGIEAEDLATSAGQCTPAAAAATSRAVEELVRALDDRSVAQPPPRSYVPIS